MAVVTEAFDIPMDIMTKLATGEYRRLGGVVRVAIGPNKGQIVKHLDPIKIEQVAQNKNVVTKVIEFSKKNRKVIIIGTAVAGTMVAGNFVHQKIKNREPKVMKRYHAALRSYIEDIRNGELSMKSINRLMDALEELKQDKRYEMLKIELTTEELDVLVNRIYEYTVKLASDNAVELTDDEKKSSDNSILNLQRYLKTQNVYLKVLHKPKDSRGFYTPSIDIHCNHQRRLNHKIQRNGGVGNERF